MSFLYSEIPINIPRTYLEGHSVLMSRLERTRWPKTPKAILTGTSWAEDDAFKVWAASKVEAGTPLVIAQHGGNYGVSDWNFMEELGLARYKSFR
jgi:putative transferase (TIGR04331 family)